MCVPNTLQAYRDQVVSRGETLDCKLLLGSRRNCIDLPMNSPKVLSRILLYMMALDFLWTILCVMAWCRRRNSRSLCVDSMEADRRSGNVKGPPSAAGK